MKSKSSIFLCCLLLFIFYSCKKESDSFDPGNNSSINFVQNAQQWLTDSGGVFKNGSIKLNTTDGIKEYRLNWAEATGYSYGSWHYLRVPFGSFADSSLGMGYHIVFRRQGTDGTILANYKQYILLGKNNKPVDNMYAENIYDMRGYILAAVGHEGNTRWLIEYERKVKPGNNIESMVNCSITGYTYSYMTCEVDNNYNSWCTLNNHSTYDIICVGDNTQLLTFDGSGGGGGGMYDPPPPPPTDPCAAAQPAVNATGALADMPQFTAAKTTIENAVSSDNQEHAVTFGRDANGNITISPMTNGINGFSAPINIGWPGAFADLHNHTNMLGPSPGDLYGLINAAGKYPGYNTRMVMTPDGSLYALVITDLVAAKAFAAAYPAVDRGFGPDFSEIIYGDFDAAMDYFTNIGLNGLDMDTNSMTYVLEKYNTGISLLKQSPNGAFKIQRVKKTSEENASNASFTSNNCP